MRDCITLLYNGLTIYRSHKLNYSKLMQLISINVNNFVFLHVHNITLIKLKNYHLKKKQKKSKKIDY